MILSFKTKINGKPTLFPEKIFAGLIKNKIIPASKEFFECYRMPPNVTELKPKIHTIREDNANRWNPGIMIDYFIGTRTVNMFRFAPRIQVISTQTIFLDYSSKSNIMNVIIDGKHQRGDKLKILAENDGFESYDDFVKYFKNHVPEGSITKLKLIHWTDFKY
ncbi:MULTISPECIES: hypothetical protein [Elizabethkingia]|uniref:hypothetical protein n=1 Tax=Elizabethkingia TaxID=308865 RepID=UPI001409FB63|nr:MULTISPECIES: hypothetical protein [Elizabethkingia]MDE5525244.1 hypothetical protein [Elizabethkingia meningoseptica]NHQ66954.1 hypothetical protein [Elizabethkingia miricola]NHQ70179.1 hypothetical protein [Elizabethkingia miricola]NHQ77029.1 hypothetical protein [Elizabethkingia miricola]UIO95064.1 hypothetical protein LYZ41_12770 [Elizabethkingia miricola]